MPTTTKTARAPRLTQEAPGAPVEIHEVSDRWSRIGNDRYGRSLDHDCFHQHAGPEFVMTRPREGVARRRVNA